MRNGLFLSRSLIVAILAAAACGDGDDNVDVVVSEIDFGGTDCGTTAIPRVLTITNNSPNSFNFSTGLALGAESPYEIIPPNGAVLPRSQLTVMIYSKPIPKDSAITDNLYGDTLTVTTDKDGDSPHLVEIKQTARGAIFEPSSDTVSIAAATPLGTTVTAPITIKNVGNGRATLDVQSTFFSVALDNNGKEVAAGADLASMVMYSPAANVEETQTLTLGSTSGATCGKTATIRVTGVGTAKALAAQAVPMQLFVKPERSDGPTTLCVRTTTGTVACGGDNRFGSRGATDLFLANLGLPSGKGGGNTGAGIAALDMFNVVQKKGGGYLADVVDLVSGTGFYCARTTNGDEWCWGDFNGYGNQVNDETLRDNPAAIKVAAGTRSIAAGYTYRCTVKDPGGVLSCRTLRVSTNNAQNPQAWSQTGVSSVVTSGGHGYALLPNGNLRSFGLNQAGERGRDVDDANIPSGAAPTLMLDDAGAALSGVTQVVAGGRGPSRHAVRFGCARKSDSSVWCWGKNKYGQIGNGTSGTNVPEPVQVLADADTTLQASTLTAGFSHVCALVTGNVVCWGGAGSRGSRGSIGSGTTSTVVPFPEAVTPTIANATSIEASGTSGTFASLSTGALRVWGQFSGVAYLTAEPIFAFEP
jgi:hypothetical protein